ncbi:MAG: ECF-type sigma factor [Opitutales bacterium]
MSELTLILDRMGRGDQAAAAEFFPLVYGELRRLASAKMAREAANYTLQPTALVHEAWLRLGGDAQPGWQNRRHFFGAAAEAMRRILIERARRRQAVRHGGAHERVDWAQAEAAGAPEPDGQILRLNEALEQLAALDAPKAELVKLRYFVGLSVEEVAQTMEISPATAHRWWVFARAWLIRAMQDQDGAREIREPNHA